MGKYTAEKAANAVIGRRMKAERDNPPPATPELARMKAVQPESQAIGNFLAWLEENAMWVGHWVEAGEGSDDDEVGMPVRESFERLLARYFQIDLAKVENERRAILAHHRSREQRSRS